MLHERGQRLVELGADFGGGHCHPARLTAWPRTCAAPTRAMGAAFEVLPALAVTHPRRDHQARVAEQPATHEGEIPVETAAHDGDTQASGGDLHRDLALVVADRQLAGERVDARGPHGEPRARRHDAELGGGSRRRCPERSRSRASSRSRLAASPRAACRAARPSRRARAPESCDRPARRLDASTDVTIRSIPRASPTSTACTGRASRRAAATGSSPALLAPSLTTTTPLASWPSADAASWSSASPSAVTSRPRRLDESDASAAAKLSTRTSARPCHARSSSRARARRPGARRAAGPHREVQCCASGRAAR